MHACMYYDLWTNNPKEMTEYPDYTYETHFGKPVPSFFPGPVMKDYFMGKMDIKNNFNLCYFQVLIIE